MRACASAGGRFRQQVRGGTGERTHGRNSRGCRFDGWVEGKGEERSGWFDE